LPEIPRTLVFEKHGKEIAEALEKAVAATHGLSMGG